MTAKMDGIRIPMASRYKVHIDRESCKICKRCTVNCTFDALSFNGERIVADHDNCVACQRCAMMCPQEAITIRSDSPRWNCVGQIRLPMFSNW